MKTSLLSAGWAAALAISLSAPAANAARTSSSPTPRLSPSILDNDDRMDVNNLDMAVTNHGSIAYDLLTGGGGLIYPRGSGNVSVFAAGIWLGALVNDTVHVALGEYAQEYVPGPMANNTFQADRPEFRNYRIERGNTTSPDYLAWPVDQGAPTDAAGNPALLGDAMIWSVFNDADGSRHWMGTDPLRVEVQQSVFAFNRAGPLGDMIFVKWRLSNECMNTLRSMYVSFWADPDLGGFTDDLVGCDTTLALGYGYNATNDDGVYGAMPPAVGFLLLQGPAAAQGGGSADTLGMTSFVKYINGTDPATAEETYNYMLGRNADGSPIHVLEDPGRPVTTYMVSGLDPGAPSSASNWIDDTPADRRLMITSGPFTMAPGETQEVVAAIIIGQGSDRLASLADLRAKVPTAVEVYRAGFHLDSPPTSISASLLGWSTEANVVRLVWSVSSGGGSTQTWVERRAEAGDWMLLGPALPSGFHRVEYEDETVIDGGRYAYRLRVRDASSEYVTAETWIQVLGAPSRLFLASAGVNPTRDRASFRIGNPAEARAEMTIHDVRGRLVAWVHSGALTAGWQTMEWNGRDGAGRLAGSGIYIARLTSGRETRTTRIVLTR